MAIWELVSSGADYEPTAAAYLYGVGFLTHRDMVSVEVHYSLVSQIATCTIVLPADLAENVAENSPIFVALGADAYDTPGFSGFVETVDRDNQGNGALCRVTCSGTLVLATREWQAEAVTFTNELADAAIVFLLEGSGIPHIAIDSTSWQIGTLAGAEFRLSSALEAANRIARCDGYRIWDEPDGTVVVRKLGMRLGPGSVRNYSASQITEVSHSRTTKDIRNKFRVEGITPEGATEPIWAEDSAPNPDVQTASGYQAGSFSDGLIETEAKALEIAQRMLSESNQVIARAVVGVPWDPEIGLGQTITISADAQTRPIRVAGDWLVAGINHRLDGSGGHTALELVGGGEMHIGGPVPPVPLFIYWITRWGDPVAVVTCISTSKDFDGYIVSEDWTDDETSPQTGSGKVMAFVYDAEDPDPIKGITLTVEDNDGLSRSLKKLINIAAIAGSAQARELFVAAGLGGAGYSPDGGLSWRLATDSGVTECLSVATAQNGQNNTSLTGDRFGFWGFASGKILRSPDGLASTPTVVASLGSDVRALWRDARDGAQVWAGTDSGWLYLSTQSGDVDTFAQYYNSGYPIRRIVSSPFDSHPIIAGGDTSVPASLLKARLVFENTWYSLSLHIPAGDPGGYAADFATGDLKTGYLALYGHGTLAAAKIDLTSGAYTTCTFPTGGDTPTNGLVTISVGLGGPNDVVGVDEDGKIFRSTDGTNFDLVGVTTPPDGGPRKLRHDPTIPGTMLMGTTAGLYACFLPTATAWKPIWDADSTPLAFDSGWDLFDLAFGGFSGATTPTGQLVAVGARRDTGVGRVVRLSGAVWDSPSALPTDITAPKYAWLKRIDGVYFAGPHAGLSAGNCSRSTDLVTWTSTLDNCVDIVRDAAGTYFAIGYVGARAHIYSSPDGTPGSWSDVRTAPADYPSVAWTGLAAHPTAAGHLMVYGSGIGTTTDGFATLDSPSVTPSHSLSPTGGHGGAITADGTYLVAHGELGGWSIWASRDLGDTFEVASSGSATSVATQPIQILEHRARVLVVYGAIMVQAGISGYGGRVVDTPDEDGYFHGMGAVAISDDGTIVHAVGDSAVNASLRPIWRRNPSSGAWEEVSGTMANQLGYTLLAGYGGLVLP